MHSRSWAQPLVASLTIVSGCRLLCRQRAGKLREEKEPMKKHLVATVAAIAILVPGAAMAETIKIGLLAPQEGVFTEPGNDGIRGFLMALNNVDGQINGRD